MRIENEVLLDYSDVLIRPKRSKLASRADATLERTFAFPHSSQTWKGIPIMTANMDTIGTFAAARVLFDYGMITCLHKYYTVEDFDKQCPAYLRPKLAVSTGISIDDWPRLNEILHACPDIPMVCFDVANGYSKQFSTAIQLARTKFPDHIIVAGNVATAEMTEQLIMDGADIVKVGIGPGSACTTRRITGVGYPQLSAVIECADAAHGLGAHIIADGGCQYPGDVAKAFGAGADFVMLGGLFAGYDETGTEFYGMSSAKAQKKYYGEVKSHRAAEGREVEFNKTKGPLSGAIQEILGGLRSACSYVGANELRHLPKCTTFVRVSRQLNNMFEK